MVVEQDEGFHDHAVTILLVAWGQFIDHDITLTAETKDIRHGKITIFIFSTITTIVNIRCLN